MSLNERHVPFPSLFSLFPAASNANVMPQIGATSLNHSVDTACGRCQRSGTEGVCLVTYSCGATITTLICLPGISCEGHTLMLLKPLLILGFLSLSKIESYILHRDSSILCSHLSLLRAIDLLCILFFLSHLFHPNGFKLHMDQMNGRSPKGRKDSLGPLEKGSMSWSQGPCT